MIMSVQIIAEKNAIIFPTQNQIDYQTAIYGARFTSKSHKWILALKTAYFQRVHFIFYSFARCFPCYVIYSSFKPNLRSIFFKFNVTSHIHTSLQLYFKIILISSFFPFYGAILRFTLCNIVDDSPKNITIGNNCINSVKKRVLCDLEFYDGEIWKSTTMNGGEAIKKIESFRL